MTGVPLSVLIGGNGDRLLGTYWGEPVGATERQLDENTLVREVFPRF